ncbi:MAG TPA: helix-turn-helix domain-containing protein [Stellaceae bacterium]|nr:helix-turn-helix domain-containing protein [Stellaceae bacterium]
MDRPASITIGELSRRTGCKVETVRYYERVGLMSPAPRTAGRYRLYDDGDVRRLAFVRRARELGFTVANVRTLLTLALGQSDGSCAQARELAAAHLAEVRGKIADLRAMERVLDDAVDQCATGDVPNCPVIDALAGDAAARQRPPRSRRAGAVRRRRG